ncbi:MAG TPA: hypothetical protein VFS58_13650 [Steroidobacteraceae bacterium]|nr:hypothetical protein [Steroidobacteraceae bacterium]
MSGSDEEFEDFLKRRKAVFQRTQDELFEPPAELDRVVLRQAREAIKPEEPMRVFSAPRWSMPIALAATLVLAFTVIFQAGMPTTQSPTPEVTVQNVAERVDHPESAKAARSAVVESASGERSVADVSIDAPASAAAPLADAADAPAWRRDAKTWLAEIERLRNAGDAARAEAEFAEFKRQQRAFAVAPDR